MDSRAPGESRCHQDRIIRLRCGRANGKGRFGTSGHAGREARRLIRKGCKNSDGIPYSEDGRQAHESDTGSRRADQLWRALLRYLFQAVKGSDHLPRQCHQKKACEKKMDELCPPRFDGQIRSRFKVPMSGRFRMNGGRLSNWKMAANTWFFIWERMGLTSSKPFAKRLSGGNTRLVHVCHSGK